MIRSLFFLAAMLILASVLNAAPFLVCDPIPAGSPVPASYSITGLGTTAVTAPVTTNTDGSVQLHYDLATLAQGKYTVTITGTNSWGVSSASSPFTFTSGAPGTPANVHIQ